VIYLSTEAEIPIHEFVKILYGRDAPRPGELVIGVITDIQDHGLYLYLLEYDKTAYVPLRELGRGVVRTTRQHYKINQTVVAKVFRTRRKIYIDASLKRVAPKEVQAKLSYWRKLNRSAHLAKLIAEKINRDWKFVVENIYSPLIECYETPFDGMEDSLIRGKHVLEECGVPKEYVDAVYEVAKENILVRKQRMKFTLEITTLAPDGIIRIKNALLKAIKDFQDITVKYESGPRYTVWVEGFEKSAIRNRIMEFTEKVEEILMSMPDAKKYRTIVRLAQ